MDSVTVIDGSVRVAIPGGNNNIVVIRIDEYAAGIPRASRKFEDFLECRVKVAGIPIRFVYPHSRGHRSTRISMVASTVSAYGSGISKYLRLCAERWHLLCYHSFKPIASHWVLDPYQSTEGSLLLYVGLQFDIVVTYDDKSNLDQ
jgi:hypothetical protein